MHVNSWLVYCTIWRTDFFSEGVNVLIKSHTYAYFRSTNLLNARKSNCISEIHKIIKLRLLVNSQCRLYQHNYSLQNVHIWINGFRCQFPIFLSYLTLPLHVPSTPRHKSSFFNIRALNDISIQTSFRQHVISLKKIKHKILEENFIERGKVILDCKKQNKTKHTTTAKKHHA